MTTEQLNSLVIGKSIFVKNDRTYRLSSFLYVYETIDGQKHRAYVDRKNANSVSGSGIGGCICSIENITVSDEVIESDNHIISSETEETRISNDKKTYDFLLSLEPNLTEDEFQDKVLDSIMF